MSTDEDYPGNTADEAEITSRIIHATWDIAPYADGETPRPFLYWKTDTEWACAAALIKRYVIVFMSCFYVCFHVQFVVNKHQMGREHNNVPLNWCSSTRQILFLFRVV